ncbi:TonB-dependent receptor [Pedobacter psychrodurus]|uniref:SusC/RagA family TonB-linked outer membrane protein n=1 Tax=Pedobacter psychrodurus TaxID=2530456 RepID=UPI00292F03F6|nr:TonB-dependent receptor [Pedobacter psychrodurus]
MDNFSLQQKNNRWLRHLPLKLQLPSILTGAMLMASLSSFAGSSNNFPDKRDNSTALIHSLTTKADVIIKGTVKDKTGVLPGVSVYVKGAAKKQTITDKNGRFSIAVPEKATLVFSFVGYFTKEVQLGSDTDLNVLMEEEATTLNETVVVGYGTQRKVNLTGAVDQVTATQLKNRPINNLGAGLQGLIPNLNITVPSGRPNGGASFNIRGTTSINGGSPLILVDNIPFTEAELARINPADVESVSVLKDAASAAIYGGRASFGVVLITTKTAKNNALTVNANVYTALRTIGKMPELVTDPYTVMDLKNAAGIPLYNLYPESVRDYAKKRSADPSLPEVILSPGNTQNWAYYGTTNWVDEAYYNTAPTTSANVSIGRSTENINYLFSGEYYSQDGMLKYGNDVYNRYNLRSKVDVKLTKWLSFANNTMLTSSDYDQPVYMASDGDFFWNVNRQNPLDVVKNPDGSWTSAGAGTLGRMQQGGRSVNRINEFQTSLSLNASLIKDIWSIKGDATIRRTAGKTNSFDIPIEYKTGPNNPVQYAGSTTSYAQSRNDNTRYDVINIYTDAHKQMGNHYLQGLVGYNQEYRKDDWFSARRNNLISNTLPSVQLATGTMTTNESIDDWALRGLFYRVNYNFKNRYLVELNGRYDGSSRFPQNDRWGFFPSASAGWLVSEESFFKPLKNVFDVFKIRASYGSLGNQYVYDSAGNLLNYPYIPTMPSSQIGQLLGPTRPTTVNAPGAVASSLTWEKVSTVNFGVDLGLFKNRLQVNFDKYTRYTKDMLVPGRTLPGVFGTAAPRFNAADLKTKGWELRLGWRDSGDLAGSPFFYSAAFVISDNKAIITKYDNPTGILTDYYEGKELGEIWGLQTEGFFQNAQELASHADQTAVGSTNQNYKFYVGDVKFADINGDNKVNFGNNTLANHGDLQRVGNSSIRYPYSFDLSGGWKNFDIRVFLQGVAKRDWYPPAANIYFWGIYAQPWTNVTVQNLDHWTPENPNAYFPAVRAYTAERANQVLGIPNERYMQDASYLRVKNITLGYSLPKNLLKKIRLSNVHFYVSGENLFEISHLKVKLDPEGLNGNIYPFQRTYSFGLNVGL